MRPSHGGGGALNEATAHQEGEVEMQDILDQLRIDPGQRTLGQLLQDREAAACEIGMLRMRLRRFEETATKRAQQVDAIRGLETSTDESKGFRPGTLIRLSEVCRMLGISRSTIYKRLSEGTFPQPIRLGPMTVRWQIEAIDSWRNALAAERM